MALRGLRVVVTGGAGFIGSHIVEALLPENEVTVVDDFSTGKEENILSACHRAARAGYGGAGEAGKGAEGWGGGAIYLRGPGGLSGLRRSGGQGVLRSPGALRGLRVLRGSVTDPELLRLALRGADVVFHLAARPSVPASVRDPAGTGAVNLGGTLAVLEAARGCDVEKVIFSSSCAVYGDARPPVSEAAPPRPLSPYAVQKLASEHYCLVYHRLYGLGAVCLRYFNVFGPRQDPGSEYAAVVPRFFRDMLERGAVTVFGDGRQTRDFIFVDDVVRATLLAAGRSAAEGRVINVATGRGTSVGRLAEDVAGVLGMPLRVRRAPPREGDIRHSRADVSLARRVLGFRPALTLREALRMYRSALLPGAPLSRSPSGEHHRC